MFLNGGWHLDVYLDMVTVFFGRPTFQNLVFYIDFKGAKETHVLRVRIWGFEGC